MGNASQQLDFRWFSVRPTEVDLFEPAFAALTASVNNAFELQAMGVLKENDGLGQVARAFRALAENLNELCPESADKTAAIRCVRLAYDATLDALQHPDSQPFAYLANQELSKARYQARAAIGWGAP